MPATIAYYSTAVGRRIEWVEPAHGDSLPAEENRDLISTDFVSMIDVVIVNWNSRTLLRECLAALDRSIMAEQINVVIVDNASTDGSADQLSAIRIRLDLVRNRQNRGFAAACNQGARRCTAPLVLFLNPDVRVRPDTLVRARQYLHENAKRQVGILSVKMLDSEGGVQRSCARTPSVASLLSHALFLDRIFPALMPPHFLAEWDHGDTRSVDQVMGAFLMIRRTLFEELGGFDERFFLYYEDVDLCLSARQAGWAVVHLASTEVEHVGQGTTRAVKDRRLFHSIQSKVEYAAKHHGKLSAALLCTVILCFELPIRWAYAAFACPPKESRLVLRAAVSFWHNLPALARNIWIHR